MELKKNEYGFYYYDDIPPTAVVATKHDFHDENGRLKVGMWFLISSYHKNILYACRVKNDFKIEKIQPWLKDKKVFIKKNAMTNYFKDCITEEEAKKVFRKKALELHPDVGGTKEGFQDLLNQYSEFKGREGFKTFYGNPKSNFSENSLSEILNSPEFKELFKFLFNTIFIKK